MAQQVDIPGVGLVEFPDTMSEAEVSAAAKRLYDEANPKAAPKPTAVTRIANALPQAGAMAGSMAGKVGPAAMAGAALGGAAGEGYKQILLRGRELPGAVADVARNAVQNPQATFSGLKEGMAQGAKDAGLEAATQALFEGAGQYVVKPIAKGIYATGLRPLKWMRDKYGMKAMVDAGFENGILPTAGGADKAARLMKDSKAAHQGMEAAFDAANQPAGLVPAGTPPNAGPFSVRQIVSDALTPVVKKARQEELATGATSAGSDNVLAAWQRLTGSVPPDLNASTLGAMRRAASGVADPAYAAARRTGEAVADTSEAGIAKALDRGYRKALNAAIGPEYAKQGLKTKTLYGLSEAAKRVSGEQHNLTNVFAVSGGLGAAAMSDDPLTGAGTAIGTRMMLAPSVQGAAGLLLTPALRYGVRGVDAATGGNLDQGLRDALLQLLQDQQPQAAGNR